LDYQPSTDNKLHIEYKTLGTMNEIQKISNPDLSNKLDGISFPTLTDAAKMEYNTNGKLLPDFGKFKDAVIHGNFDDAIQSLSMLPIEKENLTILQNGTEEQKQYIVDTYISLFAYETSYEKMKLNDGKFKNRWELFTKIFWPASTLFKPKLAEELIKEKNTFFYNNQNEFYKDLSKKVEPNIFWYTAFYRSGLAPKQKWYAATRLWKTNIIKGSLSEIWSNKADNRTTKITTRWKTTNCW
jgi:hypothetical protein